MKRWVALNIVASLVLGSPGSQAWANMRASLQSGKVSSVGTLKISAFSPTGSVGLPTLAAPSLEGGLPILPNVTLPLESVKSLNAVNAADAPVQKEALEKTSPSSKISPIEEKEKPNTVFSQARSLEQNIASLESEQEGPAEAGDVKEITDSVFDGGFAESSETGAEAVSSALAPKRSRFGRLMPAAMMTAAVGVGYKAMNMMPSPALSEAGAGNSTGLIESLGWSPALALTAAVAAPFVLILVPSFVNSFLDRKKNRVAKLTRAIIAHADKDWNTDLYHFYTKTVKRKRGSTHYLDRVTVKVPRGSNGRDKRMGTFGRIEILAQRGIPKENGKMRIESYRFDYRGDGKEISGMKEVQNARRLAGKVEREALEANFLNQGAPLARGLLARWAPNASGRGWALLAGLGASLPAFLMAGVTAHPAELFVWTGLGLVGGFIGEWWQNRYPRTVFRIKYGDRIIYWAGTVAAVGAFFMFSIPAGMSVMVGFLSSIILARKVLPGSVSWIKSPLKTKLLRGGSGFSKFKFALIALVFSTMMAGVYNPSPVSAGYRAELAARMETGAVGSEYSQFFKEHPGVPVYFVKPWHNEDMSDAIGRHYDAAPGLHPAKIMLNAESYGVRSVEDWQSLELALSTLVHELDHDRTEEVNDGAPTTLEHEHSAWDHQARFIIEQFKENPDLFKPGYNDQRKYLLLKRAQRWLDGGPEKYRDYVTSNYKKNKALADIKNPKKESLTRFYSEHRDEMQEAWELQKSDSKLSSELNRAVKDLLVGGRTSYGETVQPTDSSIYNRLLMGFLSILTILGLSQLVGLRRAKK